LSKNDKSPLPPVKNKLSSTSQNDQVNMEDSIPCDDDHLAFKIFAVKTRIQAPKTTLQGVEEAKSDPKENEKRKLSLSLSKKKKIVLVNRYFNFQKRMEMPNSFNA
jgi:hypothetical protein